MDYSLLTKPVKLEHGATYVIEIDERLSTAALFNLKQYLDDAVGDPSVRFVLLDRGVRLARERKGFFGLLGGLFHAR